MNTTVFSGHNPTQLYLSGLLKLVHEGDECSPRGKKIKELRPVIIEYLSPLKRVTFLRGRTINPFFQLAEAIWIIAGRSDVAFLEEYNKNMVNFSDDGVSFNAPYGERLRFWNKNDSLGFIFNPLDQLADVYRKIKEDPDTRQAVASIYNPLFDNISNNTKDRPCNMLLSFKLRKGKLDLQVYNRSNDIHWGTFGANLCQFSTILELMASWLGVEVGTYYQNTDSFHVYLDDYGYKETENVFSAYNITEGSTTPIATEFYTEKEPRITSDMETTNSILQYFFEVVNPAMHSEGAYEENNTKSMLSSMSNIPDEYFKMSFLAMFAYQAHKRLATVSVIEILDSMTDCSWKISCLRFLHNKKCNKQGSLYGELNDFKLLYSHMGEDIINYIERKVG